MPHFIIECNKEVLKKVDGKTLVKEVFEIALASGVFLKSNIKTRLKSYDESLVAGEVHDFIHVWGFIREGRSNSQKKQLSENFVTKLKELCSEAFVVSANIQELDENSYFKIQHEG
tara:strand:- start:47350 stop:47697 length:348 start_codon:yes stop_codon:yes gene_type:complete